MKFTLSQSADDSLKYACFVQYPPLAIIGLPVSMPGVRKRHNKGGRGRVGEFVLKGILPIQYNSNDKFNILGYIGDSCSSTR